CACFLTSRLIRGSLITLTELESVCADVFNVIPINSSKNNFFMSTACENEGNEEMLSAFSDQLSAWSKSEFRILKPSPGRNRISVDRGVCRGAVYRYTVP